MKKSTLKRIFAWIGLGAALPATIFLAVFFFNIVGEHSAFYGTLALVFISLTAIFFILAKYVIQAESQSGEGAFAADSEADDSESDIDAADDEVPDGEADEKRKAKKD